MPACPVSTQRHAEIRYGVEPNCCVWPEMPDDLRALIAKGLHLVALNQPIAPDVVALGINDVVGQVFVDWPAVIAFREIFYRCLRVACMRKGLSRTST